MTSTPIRLSILLLILPLFGCLNSAKPLSEQLPREFKAVKLASDGLFEKEQNGVDEFSLKIFPEGKNFHGIAGQRQTTARILPNGDVEVGADLQLNPAEDVGAVHVAVYLDDLPVGEYWTKNVMRLLNEDKPIGVVKAKYFPKKKRHLGLVKVKAKDVPWKGLWWAPKTAKSAYFIVSVLIVGKDDVITRDVFRATCIEIKTKKEKK